MPVRGGEVRERGGNGFTLPCSIKSVIFRRHLGIKRLWQIRCHAVCLADLEWQAQASGTTAFPWLFPGRGTMLCPLTGSASVVSDLVSAMPISTVLDGLPNSRLAKKLP